MKHSALNRGVMRDWLQVAIETASLLPTDAEIMDRFGFTSPEHARTLLADLADRGDISIRWKGEERIITLGREKPDALPGAERPVPRIVKADPDVDKALDKIKSILGHGSAPARAEQAKAASTQLKVPPAPAIAVSIRTPPAPATKPIAALSPVIVAPSPPVVAPTPPPAPRSAPIAKLPASPRKSVTVNVPPAIFDELARRAAADGIMPGTLAAQIVTAAMSGPGKLLVPAAGLRAAQVAGASVHDFASMLIRRGLEAHLAESEAAA